MRSRAVDVVVTGRVQGVFFRGSCEHEAARLGVSGWVCNAPDGSVTGRFEGDPEAIEELIDWCRHGPRYAVVDGVEVRDATADGRSGFEIY